MPTEQNMMDNNRFFVSVFYLTCFITCVSLQKIFFFLEATFDDASTQTELWKAGLWPSKFEFFLLGPSLWKNVSTVVARLHPRSWAVCRQSVTTKKSWSSHQTLSESVLEGPSEERVSVRVSPAHTCVEMTMVNYSLLLRSSQLSNQTCVCMRCEGLP